MTDLEILTKALQKYDALCYDKEEKEFVIGNFEGDGSKLIWAETLEELIERLRVRV